MASLIPLRVFHCHGMITKITYKDPVLYTSSIILTPGFVVAIASKIA